MVRSSQSIYVFFFFHCSTTASQNVRHQSQAENDQKNALKIKNKNHKNSPKIVQSQSKIKSDKNLSNQNTHREFKTKND